MSIRNSVLFICIVSLGSQIACRQRTSRSNTNAGSTEAVSRKVEIEKANLQPLGDDSAPTADELVQAYNKRNEGSPGSRRVLMELITDNHVTSTYLVVNLWRDFENEKRTLFLLEEPDGLKGTSYLLRESTQSSPEMQVNLFLPAGERRVLTVAQQSFDEGLLGSDFTYNDMRMLLPVKNWQYRVIGKTSLANESAWVLEAEPVGNTERNAWSKILFYLARNFQLLLGADFFASNDGNTGEEHSNKQMRVETFKQDNRVWTATKMTMAGPQARFTVLTLKDARFSSTTVDPDMFSADRLPLLADKIRRGWSPE